MIDPDFDKHSYGVGLANKNIEISLPIGKNYCLIASWNDIPSTMKATPRLVKAINQRTAMFGDRFFCTSIRNKKGYEICSKPYSDVLPKMDSQSIPVPEGDKIGYLTISRQNIFKRTFS